VIMADIHLKLDKPLVNVTTEDAIDLVWVPEPFEEVQKRDFNRRLKAELKKRLPKLIQQRINALQPNLQKEKDEEFNRGYSEGEEKGKQEELDRLQELFDKLSVTIQETVDFKAQLMKEAEKTIVDMAFEFARTIVGESVVTQEEIIRSHAKKTLEYIVDESKLVFHVHPDDVAQFDEKEKFIPKKYLDHIEIVADEAVSRGGCILETNSGMVDATIEVQIAELEKSVKRGLEHDIE